LRQYTKIPAGDAQLRYSQLTNNPAVKGRCSLLPHARLLLYRRSIATIQHKQGSSLHKKTVIQASDLITVHTTVFEIMAPIVKQSLLCYRSRQKTYSLLKYRTLTEHNKQQNTTVYSPENYATTNIHILNKHNYDSCLGSKYSNNVAVTYLHNSNMFIQTNIIHHTTHGPGICNCISRRYKFYNFNIQQQNSAACIKRFCDFNLLTRISVGHIKAIYVVSHWI
jgi:hypothetical protein